MIGAKVYPIELAAFGTFRLPVQGSYFKIRTATGRVEVSGNTFGKLGALDAGQGLRGAWFDDLTLTDVSGGANEIEIIVAAAEFVDDRITGEVSVIDGARGRTLAGDEFTSSTWTGAVAAGETGAVQLWNPLGSGVRLVIAGYLATNYTTLIDTTASLGAVVGVARNKRRGAGGASVCEVRRLVAVGAPAGNELWQAPSGLPVYPTAPWIIEPNRGIALYAPVAANFVGCFDFREEVL